MILHFFFFRWKNKQWNHKKEEINLLMILCMCVCVCVTIIRFITIVDAFFVSFPFAILPMINLIVTCFYSSKHFDHGRNRLISFLRGISRSPVRSKRISRRLLTKSLKKKNKTKNNPSESRGAYKLIYGRCFDAVLSEYVRTTQNNNNEKMPWNGMYINCALICFLPDFLVRRL